MSLRRVTDRFLEVPLVYRSFQAPFASEKVGPFLRRIDLVRTKRVLDVGCGPGTNAHLFSDSDYVGIDVNPDYIATASKRHRGRFVVGDVTDPQTLPTERFDCVFANSLMHHLSDTDVDSLLLRMSQLVSPDGEVHVLDLILPARTSPARVLAKLDRGRFPRSVEKWRTLFSRHLSERHFESYSLDFAGVPLWWMVYFAGVPK